MERLYLLLFCLLATPALAQTTPPTSAPNLLAQHPLLWCLLAAGAGALLGAGLMTRALRQEHQAQLQQARERGREAGRREAGSKAVKPATDYELRLRKEKQDLQQQLDEARAALQRHGKGQGKPERKAPPVAVAAGVAAPPPPLADTSAAPALVDTAVEREIPVAPEIPSPLRYAPAQETGFLRDNKLATEPLPQLPLLLTLDSNDPEKAIFSLNPHVNQAKLIGDGLHQLREWFDFDLPTGRIVAVSADTPGQLVRQGDGWQVVSRARLLVR